MKTELITFDERILNSGYACIAGVDEAGRGPLAGPVVAACVITDGRRFCDGVDDSKKLSPQKRERLYWEIHKTAIGIGIGILEHTEIDRLNIRRATLETMRMAVLNAKGRPGLVLVDGKDMPDIPYNRLAVINGDALSYSIAAASIIAKVTRDRIMAELSREYPEYGFERNMGYGTSEHLEAIRTYGPCPVHRQTFIRKLLADMGYV